MKTSNQVIFQFDNTGVEILGQITNPEYLQIIVNCCVAILNKEFKVHPATVIENLTASLGEDKLTDIGLNS